MQTTETPGNSPEAEAGDQVTSPQDTLRAQEARDELREARETIRDIVDTAASQVRARPWQSMGIALGAGLVLGLILHRR